MPMVCSQGFRRSYGAFYDNYLMGEWVKGAKIVGENRQTIKDDNPECHSDLWFIHDWSSK